MLEKTQLTWIFKYIFIILSFVILSGCSNEISENSTVVRKGLTYRDGSDKPFNGYVVGQRKSAGKGSSLTCKKHYKNGRLNGNTKYWYKNGQLESVVPYTNGKINGVVTKYYKNGQVKARVHLVDGVRGGSKGEMFWHADGTRE